MLNAQRFKGTIKGKNVQYFLKQLKNELNQKERIEYVKSLLYTQGDGKFVDVFFEEAFEQKDTENGIDTSHVRTCLNTTDTLLSNDFTCIGLERITDYILYAPDGERINKKVKYNFYPREIFEKVILNKEDSVDGLVQQHKDDGVDEQEVIDFLIRIGTNYKKTIEQKIVARDIHDIQELSDYQFVIDYLSDELDKAKESNKDLRTIKKIGRLIHDLKDDQLLCKDYRKGTIYFKQPLSDSTCIDYDMLDFNNKEHVICLLKFKPSSNFSEDLNCIVYDLQKLIKKIELNKLEKQILKLWRTDDESQKSIAEQLGISQMKVNRVLSGIAKQIGEVYKKEYDDWYYLNVEKGAYKQCSVCGEVKLVQEFNKKADNKDGFKSFCRDCEKKARK